MATRPYDSALRLRKQAELKTRIVGAAAALHAKQGATDTSYADIAAQAGVSLPTVYAHFPTQRDLLAGCTAHVGARAPALPVEQLLAAPDLRAAAEMLAAAVDARHHHFEPWLAWREDRVIPFLAELSGARRDQFAALIACVLRRHLRPGDHRDAVAAWESTLSFDFWHRLTRGHRLSRPRARGVIVRALLAIVPPQQHLAVQPPLRRKR